MSVYDENVEPGSDSFWEIGQYKKTVKRVDDGFDLCTKLMQLIQERADIEKGYSGNLKKWSAKWKTFLDKGPEYGTMKSAWIGFTEEADSMSEIHNTIRGKLVDNVQVELKTWQKENYHKSSLPPQRLKNSKDLEEKFQKAQKPWAKQYKAVQDCKKAYHTACKLEAGMQQQTAAAKAEGSAQPDALKKLNDKLGKAEKDVKKARSAYESAVAELDGLRSGYTSGMSEVFAEAQEFERGRLDFFKSVLHHLHESLNISNEERIPQTYDNLLHTVQRADAAQDLRWWSQNYGDNMPAAATTGGGGQHSQDVESPSGDNFSSNPFDDEMPPTGDGAALDDDGRQGVPVRALYEYAGTEGDELSFQAGDVFEKLDDEDEQGWCKGRKDGKVGLYPANYVELA